ncbi:Fimbrial assembly protein (PilN) [Desulfonauticus submarinus]|uniref:Fimbrial assembly protein (PilN) n=1 Tax=Desulfonauticus submarinus TaxID=206665 RepID=A0A1H0DJ43_9BACT|nr:PilN domain-containing protein [Desulfonauticus submarinus]SDN70175.1 Fimbrial assembly protein (PilN) [Desulfonauticus submarinus]
MKKDEIAATQKLLEQIRIPSKENSINSLEKFKFNIKKNKTIIGLDLREHYLVFAASEAYENISRLKIIEKIAYPKNITKTHPDFIKWFKVVIKKIKSTYPNAFYWFLIPSKYVKTFYLHIPKVPNNMLEQTILSAIKKEAKVNINVWLYDYKIIDHDLENKKLGVWAYLADKKKVKEVKQLAKEVNLKNIGITTYQFALANIFNHAHKNIAYIFIGTDWSRINIYNKGLVLFNREIKTGLLSLAEELLTYIKTQPPLIKLIEKTSSEDILCTLKKLLTEELNKKHPLYQLDKDIIKNAIAPALRRLVLQIRRTIQYYTSTIKKEEVKQIYIAGISNLPNFILEEIYSNLDIQASFLTPIKNKLISVEGIFNLSPKEEMNFSPVIGATLANSNGVNSINFLINKKQKEKIKIQKKISSIISLSFILISLIMFGYYIVLQNKIKTEVQNISILKKQITTFSPKINQEIILKLANKIKKDNENAKKSITLLKPVALLKEVALLTPKNIKLTSLTINTKDSWISIKGITGNTTNSSLNIANYILTLKKSKFFSEVSLQNQELEATNKYTRKIFEISLKIR